MGQFVREYALARRRVRGILPGTEDDVLADGVRACGDVASRLRRDRARVDAHRGQVAAQRSFEALAHPAFQRHAPLMPGHGGQGRRDLLLRADRVVPGAFLEDR